MNTPNHIITKVTKHEWVIGESDSPTTARDMRDGILCAQRDMQELGVDTSYDDAYMVRAGDGGEIILFVEVEDR